MIQSWLSQNVNEMLAVSSVSFAGFPCMLIYMAFGGLGITLLYFVVSFTIKDKAVYPVDSVLAPIILCVLAGVAFLLCPLLWCCTLCTTQVQRNAHCCKNPALDANTNYTCLSLAFWVFTLFYVVVSSALLVSIVEDQYWNFCHRKDKDNIYCLTLLTGIVMWAIPFLCVVLNVLTYCGLREKFGWICGKC